MWSNVLLKQAGRFAAIALMAGTIAACAGNKQMDDLAGAPVPGSAQDFVVNVGDRVFFEVDSSQITGAGQATLEKQAAWLNRYGKYSVTIEGHADERGTREYNLALGARRAAATRDFLASRGVNRTRLRTISYGKERPVAVCDNESCWSQNRRAVTVLNNAGS